VVQETCICTGDEESTHGEDHTCAAVIETLGVLLSQFVISASANFIPIETAIFNLG